jgi:hypothetical protein
MKSALVKNRSSRWKSERRWWQYRAGVSPAGVQRLSRRTVTPTTVAGTKSFECYPHEVQALWISRSYALARLERFSSDGLRLRSQHDLVG